MRELTEFEEENLKFLVSKNLDFTLIQPTATGLGKGIMDATFTVRNFLREKAIHNYDSSGWYK